MTQPRDILILTAMPGELAPIVRRLGLRADGRGYGGDGLRARTIGMGPVRAVERVEALLREKRPDHVVLAGYAGGLDPRLAVGDVVTVGEVVAPSRPALDLHVPGGRCVSLPQAAATVAEKRDLRTRLGADVVDMETYGVAQRLAGAGVPLTVLRAVSDTADDALPAEVLHLTDLDGRPVPGRVASYLLRGPWRLVTLLRLARAAHRAGAALGEAVAQHLDTLRR